MKLWPVAAVLAGIVLCGNGFSADQRQHLVVVNGVALNKDQVQLLIRRYGKVYVGRYWYDAYSGLYGYEGQGAAGQLEPGLAVGGSLSATASGGGDGTVTGVFINGREIHPDEYAFLRQLFGQVIPGRYWMNAQGIGGFEHGPVLFNLAQQIQRPQGMRRYDSHYLPWIGGQPGTHVGRASDGCVYVSQGGYSNDFC